MVSELMLNFNQIGKCVSVLYPDGVVHEVKRIPDEIVKLS